MNQNMESSTVGSSVELAGCSRRKLLPWAKTQTILPIVWLFPPGSGHNTAQWSQWSYVQTQ